MKMWLKRPGYQGYVYSMSPSLTHSLKVFLGSVPSWGSTYFSPCPPYLLPTHIISTAEPGNRADLLGLYASSFYIQNDYWLGLNDPYASEMYLILETIWNILEHLHSVLVARLFLLILINLNFVESMGFLSTSLIMMKYIVLGVKIFLYILADYGDAYFKENMMNNQS